MKNSPQKTPVAQSNKKLLIFGLALLLIVSGTVFFSAKIIKKQKINKEIQNQKLEHQKSLLSQLLESEEFPYKKLEQITNKKADLRTTGNTEKEVKNFSLVINSKGVPVDAFEANINYDPNKTTVLKLLTSTNFPTLAFEDINNETGKIRFLVIASNEIPPILETTEVITILYEGDVLEQSNIDQDKSFAGSNGKMLPLNLL